MRRTVLVALLAAATGLGTRCPLAHDGDVGAVNFASPQSNPIAVSPDGRRVYVANTTSNTVSVIDTRSRRVIAEIAVGLEPVSLGVRPDGLELWVSNHVSDSISVIDTRWLSPTKYTVVRTIQDIDENGVTRFDEPVGIAFSNGKGYVALSSTNDIAVIDTDTYEVTGRIHITAQDPRAIVARDGYLYVVAFESMNQTQISGCFEYDPPQCTLGAKEIGDFVTMPNLPGIEKNIVVDELIPDRDLFVIDTSTDTVVDTVSGIGTLLYGVAVSGDHRVFISQTDARNAENGLDGENLVVLENRMFENEIGVVSCGSGACGAPSVISLDPPLPDHAPRSEALATPYGIQIGRDDATLFVTAMGTSRLFTVDTATGTVLDRLDLGTDGQEVPRGVALREDRRGHPVTAYVLNTLDNSVSIVDVRDPADLVLLEKIPVGDDPTPENVRKGRIAFMNAFASDHANFSCESCHPDGNTDQLLWSIGGACFFGACSGDDEPRTTMPVRGLRDTIPLHWDGTLGDPFGGVNGAVGPAGDEPPSCDGQNPHTCFRHLVDASLAGVMCDQDPSCADGPAGLPGRLTEEERENMAFFLASVSYPPPRERAMDDVLSDAAIEGFEDFFVDHGGIGSIGGGAAAVSTCGDMDNGCHALPLLSSTNTNTLQGFDAPTLRGLNDRFIQFSMAISSNRQGMEAANVGGNPDDLSDPFNIPFLGFVIVPEPSLVPWDPAEGFEEDAVFATSFAAFEAIYNVNGVDIFQMLEEMSTGYSGAIGRQVTLSRDTTDGDSLAGTEALLAALEAADEKGVVNLIVVGQRLPFPIPLRLTYEDDGTGYAYVGPKDRYSRADLIDLAADGKLVLTATANLPPMYGEDGGDPQPLLRPPFNNTGLTGSPDLPLVPQENPFPLRGKYVRETAQLLLNGQPTGGSIACLNGSFTPYCDSGFISVTLDTPPTAPNGIHTLQVQNPGGPLSNDMPLCRGDVRADCL